jgi:hypothetical protein
LKLTACLPVGAHGRAPRHSNGLTALRSQISCRDLPPRRAVDAFYRKGLRARGRDNGAPGLRKDCGPSYYAAFLFDPDGNNIEAVCRK